MKRVLFNLSLIGVLFFGMAISCEEEDLTVDVSSQIVKDFEISTGDITGTYTVSESGLVDLSDVEELSDLNDLEIKSVKVRILELDAPNDAVGSLSLSVTSQDGSTTFFDEVFADNDPLADFANEFTLTIDLADLEAVAAELLEAGVVNASVDGSISGLPVTGTLRVIVDVKGNKPLL